MAWCTVNSIARDPVVFPWNKENSLSLDLAIVLLKDGSGVIHLEVPISGNVTDTGFNFSPAIRRAITSILTNVAVAPFRLPRNLIGGGRDGGSVEQIRFLPRLRCCSSQAGDLITA